MPKDTRVVTATASTNEIVDVLCTECKRATKHKMWASADLNGEDWFGNSSVSYSLSNQIVQCQGCEAFTFRQVSTNSEDFDADEDGNVFQVEVIALFPNRGESRPAIKDISMLPPKVGSIYTETLAALSLMVPGRGFGGPAVNL